MEDLGVFSIQNPDFFNFKVGPQKNPDGTPRPVHGFHTLPDGTLTPLHVIMGMIVAKDGTIYATTIYPFTLMKIDAARVSAAPQARGLRPWISLRFSVYGCSPLIADDLLLPGRPARLALMDYPTAHCLRPTPPPFEIFEASVTPGGPHLSVALF